MAQPQARNSRKKKPRTKKAGPGKKALQREQRIKLARAKEVLAVVSAVIIGMTNEVEECVSLNKSKYHTQAQRVRRWGNECLNLKDMELGRNAVDGAVTKAHKIQHELDAYIRERGPAAIGHYAVAWIALGYFVDEARARYVETPDIKRRWNFLASTTNTFAGMFLAEAENDRDYEAIAGEASEKVWSSIFEMPEGSWLKL